MALGLLAGVGKSALAGAAKNVAKDKAKDFITGKKKKVKPDAIKKKGGEEEGPDEKGGALAIRPQASMIPAPADVSAITPISGAEMASTKGSENEEDTLNVIRAKVIEIDKVLKGTLAQQKAASKKDKKSEEKLKRKKQEKLLEKSTPKTKGSGAVKKLMAPAKGLFGGIFDFLKNILIGRLLVVLLEKKPNLPGGNLLMFIAGMAEKVIDMIIGVLDAVGGFLAFGQEKLDGAREWLVNNKGEEAGERFDGLLSALTNLFNATVIVGSVFGALGLGPKLPGGGDQAKKAAEKAAQKAAPLGSKLLKTKLGQKLTEMSGGVVKHSAARTVKRTGLKLIGKKGVKLVGKTFGKVPIVGPLIVGVSSLLAGEPIGQAVFKGVGASLGGLLGTFIPIPVIGTLLGETIGVFVGDLLYSLILGGGPEEAGQKFMNVVKTALDVGGLIVNFFKEGFGRFFTDFPTVDIPEGGGVQTALGKIAGLIGLSDNEKFMKDGRLVKIPNLSILFNPIAMFTELIPHAAASFFPDIFGGTTTSSSPPSKTEPDEKGGGLFGGLFGGGGDQQELKGNDEGGAGIPDEGDGQTAAGTTSKGMQTGPAGYDRIGAGAAYHVDTKFHSSLGMGGMISAMDKMADAYAARDREIVFSGQGYARLKAYKSDLDPKEKKALLSSAIDAHSHSSFMRAEGFKPFDYYIPSTGIRDLYHPSTENAEILLPDFGGTTKVGALYGGYGKSANIFDTSGKHVAMTGHGDLAYAEGGETLATPHMALIGEKGKEFVIDADSYKPIERMLPGLFDAINAAKGEDAVAALMEYADYEEPAKDELVMAGGSGGGSSYGETQSSMPDIQVPSASDKGSGDWKDIRYKFG